MRREELSTSLVIMEWRRVLASVLLLESSSIHLSRTVIPDPVLMMCGRREQTINNLYRVFIRWRCYDIAIVGDLSHAYNSMLTSPVENMMRLTVWRGMDLTKPFKVYKAKCANFGDVPSANCLKKAKDDTADAGEYIDPIATNKIREDGYVDDILTGTNREEEAQRLIGDVRKEEDGRLLYSGTFARIFALAGWRIKFIMRSNKTNAITMEKAGEYVVGHLWEPITDKLGCKFSANLSTK